MSSSTHDDPVLAFLAGGPHAVVGASRDRRKYGNKVLRCFQQAGRPVFAVNPHARDVEGVISVSSIAEVPATLHGISVITQPKVTESVVAEAIAAGIRHIWMQPGAESADAVAACRAAGIEPIFGGPCLLVVLGYRESP